MNHFDNNFFRAWLVCLAGVFAVVPALAQNQSFEYGTGLKVQVPYVASSSITLDGTANEAAWDNAQIVDPTRFWDGAWSGHPEADVLASAKLLYTEGMLYVYVEVEDYDVFADPENPGQSDQILLGVDLVHTRGVTDVQTDGDFGGFVFNAPDQGPVTYKIAIDPIGVTLNWDTEANPDPVAEGWVQGATFFDETTLVWGAELAIVNTTIMQDAEIGFNLGMGHAKAEGAGDRGEATYAFSSYEVCNPDLIEELWCGAGGTVMSDAHSFATLDLLPDGESPYGVGRAWNVPSVAAGSITLDGVADEAAWADAQMVDPLNHWDGAWSGHPEADVFATGRLLHSDGMLYVHIEVEDYDVFADPENPGQSDQILLGVDLVHTAGVTDVQTDGDFAGFVANAPDQGPVTYKIAIDPIGVTLNWDTEANPDPVAEGWVQGMTFFDEATLVWGAELAIVSPAISVSSEIGFNLGMGHAKAEGAGDRGEATYAFSSFEVCNPDLIEELWCGAGGTVMSDAHSFATLTLVGDPPVAVEPVPGAEVPSEYVLEQNYPNPFNPSTTIEYAVPESGVVAVRVYNALGQLVGNVVDRYQQAGRYRADWNAETVPSGLYVYQLEVDGKVVSARKMTLVK